MRNVLRHLSAVIAPLVMGLVLPFVIVMLEQGSISQALATVSAALAVVGVAIAVLGLALVVATIRLFVLLGNGTIMPWDPTQNLVIVGLYRHVRNPMILGVLVTQTGWAIAFGSRGIAALAGLFFVVNTIYFIYSEEPGLEKRFGQKYTDYQQNVPRWIPRLRPWQRK